MQAKRDIQKVLKGDIEKYRNIRTMYKKAKKDSLLLFKQMRHLECKILSNYTSLAPGDREVVEL